MEKDKGKLMNQFKRGITVRCTVGRNDYALEGYSLFDAINILGANGANPKTKEVLDEKLSAQLTDKLENIGLNGKVLTSSANGVVFHYEEIYNKLFAYGVIEFYYNVHDDVEKIKLTDIGIEIYKERQRGF